MSDESEREERSQANDVAWHLRVYYEVYAHGETRKACFTHAAVAAVARPSATRVDTVITIAGETPECWDCKRLRDDPTGSSS